MQVKKTRWAAYNINYHLVWIPKYRKRLLAGSVKQRLEWWIRRMAALNEIEVVALEVQPDHVHLFVSAPPRFSPANLVNLLKGVTAPRLREKFPHLVQAIRGALWTRTYYVGTAGNVSADVIRRYIDECHRE
ncbi:MAG: IS200/IS605 family transposase [Candidatus Schekmanbacteria bacterium]|nr:IS200/IS605 family transposase [Candidatus Schekmanbacteria bacterium]